MKILHVTKKYPHAIGGDAVVVANLQKQQQVAGHEVAIVTSNCDEIADGPHIYKVGLKDTPAGLDAITPRRLASLVALFFKMFAVLAKEQPDIVHTHSVDMAFFVSFAARWHGIPIVHTFHIVTFYDASQSAIRRKSEIWLAKNAKPRRITAPNAYDVKRLRLAGLRQAVLLPNGVDLESWETYGFVEKSKKFTFLAVGRLERQKGYEYLVKAASRLALAQPNLEFEVIVVGEGSQKTALHELVSELGIEHIVSLVGAKSQKEIRILAARADAAVVPSLYETTPLTLLEAWSAALPVIATPVGILHDAPTDFDAACIVPPQNEQALMEAMGRCITDKAWSQAIAAKGHQEAKKYSWPIIMRAAETIYQGVL